jgi:hypothetical protein
MRQTVLGGKAATLQNDTSSISIDASTGADAYAVTFAAGFSGVGAVDYYKTFTADQAAMWSALTASSTLYLYLNHDGASTVTGGFTTLAPKYEWVATDTTSGQHTFEISTMRMMVGNGATLDPANRVFVGECTTDGSSNVSTLTEYAKRGEYDSEWFAVASSTNYSVTHNLGMQLHNADVRFFYSRNSPSTGDADYSVAHDLFSFSDNLPRGHWNRNAIAASRLVLGIGFGTYTQYVGSTDYSAGSYRVRMKRLW